MRGPSIVARQRDPSVIGEETAVEEVTAEAEVSAANRDSAFVGGRQPHEGTLRNLHALMPTAEFAIQRNATVQKHPRSPGLVRQRYEKPLYRHLAGCALHENA